MIGTQTPPQWVLHPRHAPDRARSLADALGAPLAAGHVLVNRGAEDLGQARHFLEPSLDDLHDPFRLRDLDRAIERIRGALERSERILVQGDYDVDGVTSTFMLVTVLRELGGHVSHRIPHRTRDGYGLTREAVTQAARLGCALIVTVDCGITAIDPVAYARSLGVDVVITDHHEPGPGLPDAWAVVNPRRLDCEYPFKSLAGVGVTFKLVEALLGERGGRRRAVEFLDIVALGTIADVVPLRGENRVLAHLGLERLNRTTHHGLRALIEVAGLGGRRISSGHVAFGLAPRMNAAGRMGHADQALGLLLARDPDEARSYAESLEDDNRRRREHDESAALEATERVRNELGWPACASILLWSERWHPGVLGIVASRLVERFQRPALLVGVEGERGRGSGRSLAGLDLTQVLEGCSDLLEAYGGHAIAAGVTVRRDRLPALRERFEALVRERLDPEACVPRLQVDADVTLLECDLDLVGWLERMAPHGLENPEPLFRAEDVAVESLNRVGDGKHLKLTVRDATGRADAIGFGLGEQADAVARAGRCSVLFVPTHNQWLGESRVQLKLKGMRLP